MKKKPEEWLQEPEYKLYKIIDPDGWDRKNFEEDWNKPITKEEFDQKLMYSTIMTKRLF